MISTMNDRRSQFTTIALTAAVTAAATIFARNFISGEKKIKQRVKRRYAVADPQFERSMSQLLGPPILPGNLVTPLRNGVEIFPAMLRAIKSAERSITSETFVYWEGEMVQKFSDALAAKARQGVKVHLLMDGIGCDCVDGDALRRMVDAGVELEIYHTRNFARVNSRTHRKLLVSDGRVGFTGGVGIADYWISDGEEYFPELQTAGPHRCQMFKSSPMEGSESARLMYLLSITSAERSIKVGNAYFVPDDLTMETLVEAVERGVSIKVLVPGRHIDSIMCAVRDVIVEDTCSSAGCASSSTSRRCTTAR